MSKKVSKENLQEFAEKLALRLKAVFIPFVTPQMFGAVGDGVTDDANAINSCFDYAAQYNKAVLFPSATYAVKSSINIENSINADFGGATIIYTGNGTLEDLFKYGFATNTQFKSHNGIKNLNIDCNAKANNGLHITSGKGIRIENVYITNPLEYGFLADESVGDTWEMYVNNLTVSGKNGDNSQCLAAIKIGAISDSFFENIYATNGSESWISTIGNGCTFLNVHGYSYPETFTVDKAINVGGSNNRFVNTIVDTFSNIGIHTSAPFNSFINTTFAKPAANTCIGFNDVTDYTKIDTVDCSLPITLIKSTTAQALSVKNITTLGTMVKDIELTQNKLPYHFTYDYSGRATTLIKNSINTWSMLDTSAFNLTNCSFGSNPMFRKFNGYMHISCTLTVSDVSNFQVKTGVLLPATQYLIAYNLTQGNAVLLVIWADGSIHYNSGTLANGNTIILDSTIAVNL